MLGGGRVGRRGLLGGRPVARTAAVAGTAAVVTRGVRRRGDRREDRRDDRQDRREERRFFRRVLLAGRRPAAGENPLIHRNQVKLSDGDFPPDCPPDRNAATIRSGRPHKVGRGEASPRRSTAGRSDRRSCERDVVAALLAGLDTRAISARLCISSQTVQDHLKSIFRKTGAQSRRELLARFSGANNATSTTPARRRQRKAPQTRSAAGGRPQIQCR
jgi:ATP/maltotriose-dependent transcriptional regulator MalT